MVRTLNRGHVDLRELWRRVVFNILVSSTDDHLRNHAFLWSGAGWCLSPAYDVNPTPISVRPRVHQLAIDDDDPTGDLDTAFKVAPEYGLSEADARLIAGAVGAVVAGWRAAASAFGISKDKFEHMESAFEHDDLTRALANRVQAPVPPPAPPRQPSTKRAKSENKSKARQPAPSPKNDLILAFKTEAIFC